jgi:16S rRNA U516 pseudouridylate synthase RsuA-like enzyme
MDRTRLGAGRRQGRLRTGQQGAADQRITVERQAAAEQSKRVTVLINKPVGFVSGQAEDGYTPAVVLIKPENRWATTLRRNSSTRPSCVRWCRPAASTSIRWACWC